MNENQMNAPYRVRADYLSAAEKEYFRFLFKHFSDRFFIQVKVAMVDLFSVIKPNENVQFAQRLQKKTIDFVFLSMEDFIPRLAIELDDPKQDVHRTISKFVDEVCLVANLPLLHTIIGNVYNKEQIEQLLEWTDQPPVNNGVTDHEYSPICPNCGLTMVLRFDKDGPIKGQKYYGCLNFPDCVEKILVSS